jgi:hypothetical protein
MLAVGAADPHWVGVTNELLNVNLQGMVRRIFAVPVARIYAEGVVLYMAPSWGICLLGLWRMCSLSIPTKVKIVWGIAYLTASLSAAAMVVMAFDFTRLFSLTTMQAFLAFVVLSEQLKDSSVTERPTVARHRIGQALVGLAVLTVVAELLMPARFTFMEPLPRFLPRAWEGTPWDPLTEMVRLITSRLP